MPFIRNARLVEVDLGGGWEPIPEVEAFQWQLLNALAREEATALPTQGQFRILGEIHILNSEYPDNLFKAHFFGERITRALRVTYAIGTHAWRRRTFRPVLFCTGPGTLIETVKKPVVVDQVPVVVITWEAAIPEFPDPGEPASTFMTVEPMVENLNTGILTPET